MSKRRRKRTSVKNRINGAVNNETPPVEGPQASPTPSSTKRVPASDATWEAGQLHEARADNCELRQKILELEQLNIKKDQLICALRQKVHDAEILKLEAKRAKVDEENSKLREAHGLMHGGQLKKDPETGEVYWLITEPESQ